MREGGRQCPAPASPRGRSGQRLGSLYYLAATPHLMRMCAMLVRLLRFLPFFPDIGQRLVEREIKPSACPLLFRGAAGDDRGERERDRAHHLENRIPPNRPPLLVGAKPTHEIARQAFDRILVDASKFYRLEFPPGRRVRLPDHSIFPRRFCHMAANVLSLPPQRAA